MTFVERAARWIVDRRVPIQAGIAVVSVVCLVAVGELRFELTPDSLVADAVPQSEDAQALEDAFGTEAKRLLVVVTAPDVLSPESLAYQHRIARWLESRRWTRSVQSITTTPLAHQLAPLSTITLDGLEADDELLDASPPVGPVADALSALAATDPERFPAGLTSILERWGDRPLAFGPLVEGDTPDAASIDIIRELADAEGLFIESVLDHDHRVALISATLSGDTDRSRERAARSLAAHLETQDPAPPPMTARAAGLPYVRARLVEALEADWGLLISLACLGSIAMLAMGFRSVAGVVLPMAAVGMTLAIVTGMMALLDVPIDLLTNVVPPLLITIGLGDGVHLLTRYREERRDGEAPLPAARRTLAAMSVACFMTSITTAVGFGSLMVSQTFILRRFGALAAGAVMVAYVVTVVFLPTALPAFPGERALRHAHSKYRVLDTIVERLSSWSIGRPVFVVGLSAAMLVGAVALAWNVRVDGALLDQFDGSSDVTRTARLVERHLGGVRSLSVGVRARRGSVLLPEVVDTLDEIAADLRAERGVLRVTSPGDVLRETWTTVVGDPTASEQAIATAGRIRALASLGRASAGGSGAPLDHLVTVDDRLARVEVRLADLGIRHINGIIDRLEQRLSRLEAVDAFVAGEAYQASRGLDRVVVDLLSSLGLAVLIIFGLIGVLFRSVRLALVSVPPNVLPLAAVLAWMGIRGIPLHAATVIVFGVCIGLAVDGTIHVLSRYREELVSSGHTEALRAAMTGSGRAIVLSSAALLLGFLALQISGFVPVRRFGELSVVAVVAALLAELTLLPALMSLARTRRERTR